MKYILGFRFFFFLYISFYCFTIVLFIEVYKLIVVQGKFFDMLSRALNTAEAGMVLQESMFPRLDAQTLREFQIGDEDSVKQVKINII